VADSITSLIYVFCDTTCHLSSVNIYVIGKLIK